MFSCWFVESVFFFPKVDAVNDEKKTPLFRTIDRKLLLSPRAMQRTDALRMVKRRAVAAGLSASTCNHTFRATGITT